jgi:hypothetical protein
MPMDPWDVRVTARFGAHAVVAAHRVLWSHCCRRGDQMMGFGHVDARTLRARPPLVVTDAAGRRQPVGLLAVGTDVVWTLALESRRLWRVPLAGGPARALRVAGFPHGLAVDGGAVWVVSGTGEPGSGLDRTGRLRRLDPRTGEVSDTTPLPEVDVGRVNVAVGLPRAKVPCGWPVRTRGGCRVAASCCGSILPPGGWPGGSATHAGSSKMCLPAGRGWPPRHPSSCTWSPGSARRREGLRTAPP